MCIRDRHICFFLLSQDFVFNYLGNNVGYDRNYDIDVKLGKFKIIYVTINRIFRKNLLGDKTPESDSCRCQQKGTKDGHNRDQRKRPRRAAEVAAHQN